MSLRNRLGTAKAQRELNRLIIREHLGDGDTAVVSIPFFGRTYTVSRRITREEHRVSPVRTDEELRASLRSTNRS